MFSPPILIAEKIYTHICVMDFVAGGDEDADNGSDAAPLVLPREVGGEIGRDCIVTQININVSVIIVIIAVCVELTPYRGNDYDYQFHMIIISCTMMMQFNHISCSLTVD